MANYINNKQLNEAMKDYILHLQQNKEKGLSKPVIPNYIGECIYSIARRLATKPNFSGYSYKEEMISDGIENCIMYLHNFNPDKSSNPFAYFTQIIKFAFIRRIQKEQKQQYIKIKNLENLVIYDDYGETSHIDNEISSEFVKNFENTNKKKKEKTLKGVEIFIGDENE